MNQFNGLETVGRRPFWAGNEGFVKESHSINARKGKNTRKKTNNNSNNNGNNNSNNSAMKVSFENATVKGKRCKQLSKTEGHFNRFTIEMLIEWNSIRFQSTRIRLMDWSADWLAGSNEPDSFKVQSLYASRWKSIIELRVDWFGWKRPPNGTQSGWILRNSEPANKTTTKLQSPPAVSHGTSPKKPPAGGFKAEEEEEEAEGRQQKEVKSQNKPPRVSLRLDTELPPPSCQVVTLTFVRHWHKTGTAQKEFLLHRPISDLMLAKTSMISSMISWMISWMERMKTGHPAGQWPFGSVENRSS